MARTLDEIIATLPKAERDAIAIRAQELVAEEMSLQAIRKAMGKTQVAVAKRLKLRQDAVSKIETRADMLISTLRGYLKAVGGKLELVVTFPVAAGKAANLVGERPMPSIARFGRLAYPMRGEVTNRAVLGRKRHSRSDSRSGLSAVGTIRVAANSEA